MFKPILDLSVTNDQNKVGLREVEQCESSQCIAVYASMTGITSSLYGRGLPWGRDDVRAGIGKHYVVLVKHCVTGSTGPIKHWPYLILRWQVIVATRLTLAGLASLPERGSAGEYIPHQHGCLSQVLI